MRRADGYSRCTRALATRRIAATRSATPSVLICSSGVPGRTRAASRTSSRVTAPMPVTMMLRADIIGVKYRISPSAVVITVSSSDTSEQLQTPDRPARNGFGLAASALPAGYALGLAASLLDRDRAGLRFATFGAFATLPPTRALLDPRPAPLPSSPDTSGDGDRFGRQRFPAPGSAAYLVRRDTVRLGHRNTPGRPGALRLARTAARSRSPARAW